MKATEQAPQLLLVQLGERVRAERHARGLTLRELSERARLSERFVSDLEAGRANISVLKLEQLAVTLGLSASLLLAPRTRSLVSPRNVVALLGLRGAGKTSVGRALASRLRTEFFELDRLVEVEAGMELSELFAIHGEGYYREVEFKALRRFLSEHERAVLATGGGLVTSPDAFRLLTDRTYTVWLKASPEEHWQRVIAQGDTRPMANRPLAMAELRRRMKEREPLYAQADATWITTQKSVSQIVRELSKSLAQA